MQKLYELLNLLIKDIEIPETFLPHAYIGQCIKRCMELSH